jgi:hypothetical protein
MFENVGRLLSSQETFFAVVNSASYGGTRFNVPDEWLPYLYGTPPEYNTLPPMYEAILEIDVEATSFFRKKGTVVSDPPCGHPKLFPIVYLHNNAWFDTYKKVKEDVIELITAGNHEDAIEWIDGNLSDQEIPFPDIIAERLKYCRHHHLPLYSGNVDSVKDSLLLAVLDSRIQDTRDFFARRIESALDMLTETFRKSYDEPPELLLKVLRSLKVTQLQIGPPKPDAPQSIISTPEVVDQRLDALSYVPPDSTVASFQDRGPHLDELRDIITRGSEK